MNSVSTRRYDVAIVGGGVAGCYCAYRLSSALPDVRIALFESGARLGGRLESKFLQNIGIPAELGGAFVCDLHTMTFNLLQKLRLPLTPIDWSRQFSFVRGHRLTDRDYRRDPDAIPYALSCQERGRAPADILHSALHTIAPRFCSLWPIDRAASPHEGARYLQQLCFKDRLLHDWDIGALLREAVSDGAYESFRSNFGSAANFRNASAYDAIRTLMFEMATQQPFIVADGFQRLPLELARRSRAEVHTSMRLLRLGKQGEGLRLSLLSAGGEVTVDADKVILALPPAAVQTANPDIGAAEVRALHAQLSKLSAVSACKLFLSFERPWWRTPHATSALGVSASYTDLPMQQCYYYGAGDDAPALLLAAFADDTSAAYWRPLSENDAEAAAPSAMIAASLSQLRAMHRDADIPDPVGAVARHWPAAWHAWKPGARSWESARRLRGPHLGLPLYLCGEGYSEQHGWVEGALASANALLSEHFGLDARL